MRQMKAIFLVGLLGLVAAAPATAGEWLFGAKTGALIVDSDVVKDDAINTGVFAGYQMGVVLGDVGVEAVATTTTGDGKLDTGQKLEVDTYAGYVTFRTAGPIYLKVKGGYMEADIAAVSGTESGASYGAGLGFSLGIILVELEYIETAFDDVDVAFASVSAVAVF